MKITVTQEDIDRANADYADGDALCHCCPVAQALRRTFPGELVNVGVSFAMLRHSTINLPPAAQAITKLGSAIAQAQPTTFDIIVPPGLGGL